MKLRGISKRTVKSSRVPSLSSVQPTALAGRTSVRVMTASNPTSVSTGRRKTTSTPRAVQSESRVIHAASGFTPPFASHTVDRGVNNSVISSDPTWMNTTGRPRADMKKEKSASALIRITGKNTTIAVRVLSTIGSSTSLVPSMAAETASWPSCRRR